MSRKTYRIYDVCDVFTMLMNFREILVERFEHFVVDNQHQFNVTRSLVGIVGTANLAAIRRSLVLKSRWNVTSKIDFELTSIE